MGIFSTIGTVAGGVLGAAGGPAGAAAGAAAGGAIGGLLDPKKKVDTSASKKAGKQATAFGQAVKAKREGIEASPTEAPTVSLSGVDRSAIGNVGAQATTSADQASIQQALMARARGEAPSAAEKQMKQASDRALAQQIALGRAQGTAASARTAQRTAAQTQQQIASDTAILRAQEQAQAEKAAAEGAATIRQQEMGDLDRQLKADFANQGVDLDVLKLNALQGNEEARINLEAQLRSRGMDDDMIRAYLAAEAGSLGQALSAAQASAQIQQANLASERQGLGAVLSAAGGFAASQSGNKKTT